MNHKVVSVTNCGREDVYDITVDKYHNFATEAGVFVHNCVETIPDPFGNRLLPIKHPKYGDIRILCEISDPPEAISYEKKGIMVSDFIKPEWYDSFLTPGFEYSFTGSLKTPLTLLPGGYFSFIRNGKWYQETWLGTKEPKVRLLGKPVSTLMLREWVDRETCKYRDKVSK